MPVHKIQGSKAHLTFQHLSNSDQAEVKKRKYTSSGAPDGHKTIEQELKIVSNGPQVLPISQHAHFSIDKPQLEDNFLSFSSKKQEQLQGVSIPKESRVSLEIRPSNEEGVENKNPELNNSNILKNGQAKEMIASKKKRSVRIDDIKEWISVPQDQRSYKHQRHYCERKQIGWRNWRKHIEPNGELKGFGYDQLIKSQGKGYRLPNSEDFDSYQREKQEGSINLHYFSCLKKIDYSALKKFLNEDGSLKVKGIVIKDSAAGNKYQAISAENINEWQNLSQETRYEFTLNGYSSYKKINPEEWRKLVKIDGTVTLKGQTVLDRVAGIEYRPITAEDIKICQIEIIEKGGEFDFNGFAAKRGIKPTTLKDAVKTNGELTITGRSIIGKAGGKYSSPVTGALINQWCNMTPDERLKVKPADLAEQHRVDPASFVKCVRQDGTIRPDGQAIIDKEAGKVHKPITPEAIASWKESCEKKGKTSDFLSYAIGRNVSARSFYGKVRMSGGLSPEGAVFMKKKDGKKFKKITPEDIFNWYGKPDHERTSKMRVGFADDNNFNSAVFKKAVNIKGRILPRGGINILISALKKDLSSLRGSKMGAAWRDKLEKAIQLKKI